MNRYDPFLRPPPHATRNYYRIVIGALIVLAVVLVVGFWYLPTMIAQGKVLYHEIQEFSRIPPMPVAQ